MHFVIRDNVPCWYYLAYTENLLQVRIHSGVKEYFADTLTQPLPIIDDLGEQLKIGPFVFTTDRWGFDSAAYWKHGEPYGWSSLCLPYPPTQRSVTERLSAAEENSLFALSATLKVTFIILNGFGGLTEVSSPQSMTIEAHTARDMCGGTLCANLSPAFRSWLSLLPNRNCLRSASKNIMEAFRRLWDKEGSFDLYDFLVSADEEGYLHLKLGSGKSLDPDYYFQPREEQGYRISSSNVDHPAYQLPLLAGLAELSESFYKSTQGA